MSPAELDAMFARVDQEFDSKPAKESESDDESDFDLFDTE